MALTRLAITRPLAILMLIVGLVLMGAVSYTRMKVDRFPAISFPAVFVSIAYAGAAPTDMEELITKPVENARLGPARASTRSRRRRARARPASTSASSRDRHQPGRHGRRAADLVDSAAPAQSTWTRRTITKADMTAIPVMNIALSGRSRSLAELYRHRQRHDSAALQSVDGVADVQFVGGLQREIQVKIEPDQPAGVRRLADDDPDGAHSVRTSARRAGASRRGRRRRRASARSPRSRRRTS